MDVKIKSFDQFLQENYTEQEIQEIRAEGKKRADDYMDLKKSISNRNENTKV